MFNERQNKRLTALAFYIDAEIAEVDVLMNLPSVKGISWKVDRYREIRSLLSDASNSIRDARDIDEVVQ